jgi:CheY-like chemotaxis protein
VRVRRVLLIDDSLFSRKLGRVALERAGYEVAAVASAEQGLEQVRANGDVGLIVCDAGLRGITELAAAVRSEAGAEVPVIAVAADGASDGLIDAGFSRVLRKFSAAKLVASVGELLAGPPGTGGLCA